MGERLRWVRIADADSGLRVEGLRRAGLMPASFSVAPAECLPVAGPSGSGKSLLLRAIADLDPSRGELSAGRMIRAELAAAGDVSRRRIGLVGRHRRRPFCSSRTARRHCARPATINAMAATGLVFLPGMMTGLILAEAPRRWR